MPAAVKPSMSEAEVKDAVAKVPAPDGVKLQSVFFDVDRTGDDAVYAVFTISRNFGIEPVKIRSLSKLHTRVLEAIDKLDLGLLPYVRFVDAR